MADTKISLNLRTLLSAGYVLVLALMVVLARITFSGHQAATDAGEQVSHTHEVIAEARLIERLLVEMEAEQRGYLITGDESLLEPYYRRNEIYDSSVVELINLVADNPSQVRSLNEIDDMVARWHKIAAEPEIEIRRAMQNAGGESDKSAASSMSQIQEMISEGVGQVIIDEIKANLDEFILVEERLLEDRQRESDKVADRSNLEVIIGTGLAIIIGLVAMLVTTSTILRQVGGEPSEIAQATKKIAKGNLDVSFEGKTGIGASVALMLEALREASGQAKKIAQGDYSSEIAPRSDSDELGIALNTMTKTLRDNRERAEAETWIKTGGQNLGRILEGDQPVLDLTQGVVTFLAKYLGAQMASLYILDEADNTLVLSGTYAFNKRKSLNERIKIGEGLAGQAAREKDIISVTEIPSDFVRISSSLGDSPPSNIIALPFVHDNKLVGVVEFASLDIFSDNEMLFLSNSIATVGIAFNSAIGREKMRELLAETQRQAKILSEQTETLQRQREELKASNEELEQQTEELRVSNEELEERTEALETQKTEIEDGIRGIERAKSEVENKAKELELASKYKSEFLANMSHELRTPLNSLLILSKILANNQEGNLTEGQIESAEVIYSGGQDLLLLINEILDLSKVEAGKMEVQNEEVTIEDIVENIQHQFKDGAKEKGLEFKISTGEGIPKSITTDGQRLGQILRNFLSNALKFTSTGSIGLEIARPGDNILFSSEEMTSTNTLAFSVSDTGPGISKEKQSAIFEAFQQADGSTSRRYGGTGLGLSISRALANLLSGEIHLESSEGQGSVFTLFIPFERRNLEEDVNDPASRALETPKRRAVRPDHPSSQPIPKFIADDRNEIKEGDKSVLIIEDEKQFAKILLNQVQKKGFKGLVAGDGSSGLGLASEYKPHAIILDLGLPDIDGSTVLDGLKYNLETRHIPVHVMSARDKSLEIMQKGAIEFLTKPISADDIDAALGRIEKFITSSVRNVLVVEDDMSSQTAIRKLLSSQEVVITGVATGSEAQQALLEKSFDCIILDLGLPDMTGFEFLEKIDSNKSISMPPTIVYTGKELKAAELRKLGRYTTNVVVKGANSPERLLDETSLFLHTVEASLPTEQKKMLRMLHDPEELLKNRKILLVDDDLRNSFAVSKLLKNEGLSVVMAENGLVALEMLEKESDVELILMDIMMPIMDGYEAMGKIRSQKRYIDLPIVALTAKAMVEDRAKCIAAGANDYLTKPIDVEKMMSLIRVLLYR